MPWIDPRVQAPAGGPLASAAFRNSADLHALWACGRPQDTELGLLLELDPQAGPAERAGLRALVGTPDLFPVRANFVTGQLPMARLAELTGRPGLLRWRIGQPVAPRDAAVQQPLPVAAAPWDSARDQPPWVAIIDHGLAFANRQFRRRDDPARSRFVAFWDQDRERLAPARNPDGRWQPVPGLGRGGWLDRAGLDAQMVEAAGDELRLYRELRYEPAAGPVSHGTHVLDLAAGRPDPLAARAARGGLPPREGRAADAPIVAVQLPYRPRKDPAGQALGPDVLEALYFIERMVPPDRAVVVNLSDGAYGGPHDGQSLAERAIDDFLARHPRVHLVVAAGNAAGADLHAVGKVGLLETVSVDWLLRPDDRTESFCEIWFDRRLPREAVAVRLEPPGGLEPVEVMLGDMAFWRPDPQAPARAAVLSTRRSPNHVDGSSILIAVAPTRAAAGTPPVPHGPWRISLVSLRPGDPVPVHLWVERDDPVVGEPGPRRQSRLRPVAGGGLVISESRILGSLAGSAESFVVAGVYRQPGQAHRLRPGRSAEVPPYVSRGPGRAPGARRGDPDIAAPCDEGPGAPGLQASGSRSGTRLRMDGTSVAAPRVTRRLLDLIAGVATTGAQLRQALGIVPGQMPRLPPSVAEGGP